MKKSYPSLAVRPRSRRSVYTAADRQGEKKGFFDLASSAISFGIKLGAFLSLVTLALYLGAAQHVVSGFDLADVFLLVAIAIAAALFGVVITIIGAAVAMPYVSVLIASIRLPTTSSAKDFALARFWVAAIGYAVLVPWTTSLMNAKMHVVVFWVWLAASVLAACGVGALWTIIQRRLKLAASKRWGRLDDFGIGLPLSGQLIVSGLLTAGMPHLVPWEVFVYFIVVGYIFAIGLCLQGGDDRKSERRSIDIGRGFMAGALILAPFIVLPLRAFDGETGAAKAFQAISLYVPHATVVVSEPNFARLERVARQHGTPLQACRHADGSATLTNVRVLWHTLGDQGLVELGSKRSDEKGQSSSLSEQIRASFYERLLGLFGWKGVRVPVENKGLTVLSGSTLRCMEVSGLLFQNNSSAMTKEARDALHLQLRQIHDDLKAQNSDSSAIKLTPVRLEVVGHADPRKRALGTNEELAQKRAAEVERVARQWMAGELEDWGAVKISSRSEGARELARKCDQVDDPEAEACHAFNRRVVLQLAIEYIKR